MPDALRERRWGTPRVAATAATAAAVSGAGADFAMPDAVPDAGEGNINPMYAPVASSLSVEERFALCRGVGVECIQVRAGGARGASRPTPSFCTALAPHTRPQEDELRALLAAKAHPVCYDGFEPSGRMHIAQGLLKALIVRGPRVPASGALSRLAAPARACVRAGKQANGCGVYF